MEEDEKAEIRQGQQRESGRQQVWLELHGTGMKTVEHRMKSGRQQVWLELYGTGMKTVEHRMKSGRQ